MQTDHDNLGELKMFLINLTYIKPLSEIDRYLPEHSRFLDSKYAQGIVVFSGRKRPRTGGVILLNVRSQEEAQAVIQQDPFHRENLANYEIIHFIPTKYDPRFKAFVNESTGEN
jgi:uncharacterized protein YciI